QLMSTSFARKPEMQTDNGSFAVVAIDVYLPFKAFCAVPHIIQPIALYYFFYIKSLTVVCQCNVQHIVISKTCLKGYFCCISIFKGIVKGLFKYHYQVPAHV